MSRIRTDRPTSSYNWTCRAICGCVLWRRVFEDFFVKPAFGLGHQSAPKSSIEIRLLLMKSHFSDWDATVINAGNIRFCNPRICWHFSFLHVAICRSFRFNFQCHVVTTICLYTWLRLGTKTRTAKQLSRNVLAHLVLSPQSWLVIVQTSGQKNLFRRYKDDCKMSQHRL